MFVAPTAIMASSLPSPLKSPTAAGLDGCQGWLPAGVMTTVLKVGTERANDWAPRARPIEKQSTRRAHWKPSAGRVDGGRESETF